MRLRRTARQRQERAEWESALYWEKYEEAKSEWREQFGGGIFGDEMPELDAHREAMRLVDEAIAERDEEDADSLRDAWSMRICGF